MSYNQKITKIPDDLIPNIPDSARELGGRIAGGPHIRPGEILYIDDQGAPGWNSTTTGWVDGEIGGELMWAINDDYIVFGHPMTPYKMYKPSTDELMLKIINFPNQTTGTHQHHAAGGESMWVLVTDGNDNEGVGLLENEPTLSNLQYGDLIRYGNGTEEAKAEFIEVIENPSAYQLTGNPMDLVSERGKIPISKLMEEE